MRLTTIAILSLLACAPLAAQHWPSFRGPGASGVVDGSALPVSWDVAGGANIRWKTAVPGLSVSSPIAWGDRIYVSTAVGSDPTAKLRHGLYSDVEPSPDLSKHTWRLLALDAATGRVVWDRVAHEGVPRTKRHPKASQASATPATDGAHVVVSFGSEGLFAYDTAGAMVWKQDLGLLNAGWFFDPDYEWGFASSPIIWNGLVIVQCDIQKGSFIAAFDVRTGKPVWRTQRDEIPGWSTPTIYQNGSTAELITQGPTFTRGYNPRTGEELWRLSGHSEITVPTPITTRDLIVVSNGYKAVQPIFAIRPGARGDITLKEGSETSAAIAWSSKRGGPYLPTPIIYGDTLYVVLNNGVFSAYDVKTGSRHYQERLGGKGGAFTASPVAADGRIYLASEDGEVFVVKAGTSYELLATNTMGEVLMATPAIINGALLVRGMQHVFAIGSPRGAAPSSSRLD